MAKPSSAAAAAASLKQGNLFSFFAKKKPAAAASAGAGPSAAASSAGTNNASVDTTNTSSEGIDNSKNGDGEVTASRSTNPRGATSAKQSALLARVHVGATVAVYWPADAEYYPARVRSVSAFLPSFDASVYMYIWIGWGEEGNCNGACLPLAIRTILAIGNTYHLGSSVGYIVRFGRQWVGGIPTFALNVPPN